MNLGEQQPTRRGIGRRTYAVAHVAPLDIDGVRTAEVGTVLWLIGFLGLLPFWGVLKESGHTWWLWTCMAGVGLGLCGLEYCRRRQQQRRGRGRGAHA